MVTDSTSSGCVYCSVERDSFVLIRLFLISVDYLEISCNIYVTCTSVLIQNLPYIMHVLRECVSRYLMIFALQIAAVVMKKSLCTCASVGITASGYYEFMPVGGRVCASAWARVCAFKCVALLIQHALRMRHIAICSFSGATIFVAVIS